MNSFNLAERPWVPCERLDGAQVELSTADVLAEAHELRAIVDSSPLVVAVLHRHLLAVLHRAFDGPKNMKEWAVIAKAGRFDRVGVETYLSRVHDRMDLFHATHPFAQTRGLVAQFSVDPIDQLDIERSSWGGGRALFQHRPMGYRGSMTPARAARGLLAHHAFATGGLVKKPNEPTSATAAPLVRSAIVILRGGSLFRTLVSNLLRYDPDNELPVPAVGIDTPSWEQPTPPTELRVDREPARMPVGWLDMLTWLSRRIELVLQEDAVVGYVGAVFQGIAEQAPRDPMIAYRCDEKRGFVPIGLDPDRAFWRNANALFESTHGHGSRFVRPQAVDLVASPAARLVLGNNVRYSVDLHGISAYQSRVDLVRIEHVHALARLFDDPNAREDVERAIKSAETAVSALKRSLWTLARHALAPGDRAPDAKDVTALATSFGAEPAAWSALGVEFDGFLSARDGKPVDTSVHFDQRCCAIAWERFNAATSFGDGSARWLKARVHAERALRIGLAVLTPAILAAEDTRTLEAPI